MYRSILTPTQSKATMKYFQNSLFQYVRGRVHVIKTWWTRVEKGELHVSGVVFTHSSQKSLGVHGVIGRDFVFLPSWHEVGMQGFQCLLREWPKWLLPLSAEVFNVVEDGMNFRGRRNSKTHIAVFEFLNGFNEIWSQDIPEARMDNLIEIWKSIGIF